jgi:hypothetical protein
MAAGVAKAADRQAADARIRATISSIAGTSDLYAHRTGIAETPTSRAEALVAAPANPQCGMLRRSPARTTND